jgi:hypothetical protein
MWVVLYDNDIQAVFAWVGDANSYMSEKAFEYPPDVWEFEAKHWRIEKAKEFRCIV